MTPEDVALAFGVSEDRVHTWITQAKLHVSGDHDITDADLVSFLHVHRTAFDLRTVDQAWFLDFLLGDTGDRGDSRATFFAMKRQAFLADLRQSRRVRASAHRVGLARTTIYQWARTDPMFRQQLTECRRACADAVRAPRPDARPRNLSLDQAAAEFHVSRRTIYYRIREGRLQTIRTMGGSQRVLLT